MVFPRNILFSPSLSLFFFFLPRPTSVSFCFLPLWVFSPLYIVQVTGSIKKEERLDRNKKRWTVPLQPRHFS